MPYLEFLFIIFHILIITVCTFGKDLSKYYHKKQKYIEKTPLNPVFTPIISTNKAGSLTVYTGPMFCGKTTHLITEITKWVDINRCNGSLNNRPLLINHCKDIRDKKNIISSHSSSYKGLSSYIDVISSKDLISIDTYDRYVIAVDEAQFFPDLVEAVTKWLSEGIHVYCAGLDSDYKMEIFGSIHMLVHLADNFTKLPAICSICIRDINNTPITPSNLSRASFTARIDQSVTNQIQIGGSDLYIPVCRRHLNESFIQHSLVQSL